MTKVINDDVGNTSNLGLELAKMLQKEINIKFAYNALYSTVVFEKTSTLTGMQRFFRE